MPHECVIGQIGHCFFEGFICYRLYIFTLFCILQDSQFWKLFKENRSLCSVVMRTSAGLVYILACLLEPFMPSFTVEVIELHAIQNYII